MDEKAAEGLRFGRYFLVALAVLVFFGLVMVFSSSYIYAKETYGGPYYFVLRQLVFLVLGILVMVGVARVRFSFWLENAFYLNAGLLILLILTLVPALSSTAKGASRWITWSGFNLQPGEFLKFSIILAATVLLENFAQMSQKKLIQYLAVIVLPLLILVRQPDFGTFSICVLVVAFVAYMSSFPRRYLSGFALAGILSIVLIMFTSSYRVQRILGFLDPWKNPQTSGFQIIQSYLGFANGSWFGLGLGNGHEKLFYLPEAHNDFIFSVIGEELGLVGVLGTIVLVVLIIYFGMRIALACQNRWGLIVIASIVFTLGLQSFFNMGVVLGLLPTKGLNLPFVSYGGSSLVANFWGIGLIFSALRESLSFAQNNAYNQQCLNLGAMNLPS